MSDLSSPKLRPGAMRRWRVLTQILVTSLALGIILTFVPYHDRAYCSDGSFGIVLNQESQNLRIRIAGVAEPEVRSVPLEDVHRIEPGLRSLIRGTNLRILPVYILCSLVAAVAMVLRWGMLLRAAGATISLRFCATIWARGQVINLLPPSQVVGELYRIERSARWLTQAGRALGVVACERLMGLLGLLFVSSFGASVLVWQSQAASTWLVVTGLGFIAAMLVAALAAAVRWSGAQDRVVTNRKVMQACGPAKLTQAAASSRWRQLIVGIVQPLGALARQPRILATTLVASILVHLLSALSFAVMDRALGIGTPAWCYLIAVPAVTLAQLLPVHIAGIGVMEGGLYLLLSELADRTSPEVLAISAGVRLMGLIWLACLSFSFVFHAGAPPTRQSPSDTPACHHSPVDSDFRRERNGLTTRTNAPPASAPAPPASCSTALTTECASAAPVGRPSP